MEERKNIERHIYLREHYWNNAHKALKNKEYEKASEFIWGSFTQLLQALALLRGLALGTHAKMKGYVREIARELNNEEVLMAFEEGEKLHANFYRSFLGPYQINSSLEIIKKGMEVLLRSAEGMR